METTAQKLIKELFCDGRMFKLEPVTMTRTQEDAYGSCYVFSVRQEEVFRIPHVPHSRSRELAYAMLNHLNQLIKESQEEPND